MIESQGWCGLGVLLPRAERPVGGRLVGHPDTVDEPLLLDARGVIRLDLGGPPGGEVVGVQVDGGPFVFRKLADCRILVG